VILPPAAARIATGIPTICPVVFDWEGQYIAEHLRAEDRLELSEAQPLGFEDVIRDSLAMSGSRSAVFRVPAGRLSLQAWEPVAVFGVAPYPGLPHVGIPWLLATRRFDDHRIRLVRGVRRMLYHLRSDFAQLENHVHADNARSVRFLEWLGFTVEPAAPWGHKGAMFRRFWWKRGEADV
jgi:hypothetical protein